MVVILFAYLGYCFFNSASMTSSKDAGRPTGKDSSDNNEEEEDDNEIEKPRNFTQKQLLYFDGNMDPKTQETKPVYLSVNGIVFDVTKGKDYYGPGGPYELFAGHECGVALAKMSFDAQYLDDLEGCSKLNYGEKEELDNWINKFEHWRCYPIKGRLIPDGKLPDPDRVLSLEDLWKNNGEGPVPDGYASAPIYIGAHDKVYDVSFGGVSFYGKGCSYNVFAGRNAARALATMSLDPEVAKNPDISDLTEKQIKVLNDWKHTFEERKCYPVVGRLAA
jgi:membrane-associated progesterone receptor component